MPTVTVTLDIKRGLPTPSGYTLATDADNPERHYCYKFTGGTDGAGNVTCTEETDIDVNITGGDYDCHKISFQSNPGDQFNTSKNGKNGKIKNKKTSDGTFYYDVRVKDDGDGNSKFTCDPKVINVPT